MARMRDNASASLSKAQRRRKTKKETYPIVGAACRLSKSLSPAERSSGIQGERDLGYEGAGSCAKPSSDTNLPFPAGKERLVSRVG